MKIDKLDLSKVELTDWRDPRIPSWWSDPAVWRYLGWKYGLRRGGIIDDGGPPMLVIESM